jgi:hypothetical protein
MPKTIVCLSMASTYRFWFSVLGRMVRPRLLRMLRLRTSADRALYGLGGDPLTGADDGDQLVHEPLGERHLRRLAAERDLVAAHVDVCLECLLDQGQVLVPGAEEGHHGDARGHHDRVLGDVGLCHRLALRPTSRRE